LKRIIVAPDSFKESLDANRAADAIAAGFKNVFPDAEIIRAPMADGGEGLVHTLVAATGGEIRRCPVTGPLGKPVQAFFGVLGDATTCVIEMAAASGLPLVPLQERNPLVTTTYGTGELLLQALETGCKRIIIGIGGSATNDGGAGMAQALGARLLNASGDDIPFGALGLQALASISAGGLDPRLAEREIIVAVDVKNPLCGPDGAAYVYAPQKGATPEMLPLLDQSLQHYAQVIRRDLSVDVADLPGAGAAGGLGAGLMAFLGATLRPGIDVVLDVLQLEAELRKGVDLVVTGEGQLNRQTTFGKVPAGVAGLAKKYNTPVLALVGSLGPGAELVLEYGIDAYFPIIPRPMDLPSCLSEAYQNLEATAKQCALLIHTFTSRL
jgi:glycerate 2-kinase